MNSSLTEVAPGVKCRMWAGIVMACLGLAGCSAYRRDTMPAGGHPTSVMPSISASPAVKPAPRIPAPARDTKSIPDVVRPIGKPVVLPEPVLPENPALQRYTRRVTSAIETQWKKEIERHARDLVSGRLLFRFYVNRHGTPQDLQILSNSSEADPRLRELTLRAVLDAQIPPIPPDLLPTLDNERVKIEYEALVY